MKKLIFVGMNPKTRHLINWEEDAIYFTLNEAPSKDWAKRYDVLFQIHPRWDWDRTNNIADPNHPLYIKAQSSTCLSCKGEGKAFANGESVPCPWCEYGTYKVPDHRWGKEESFNDERGIREIGFRNPKTIIMQDMNEDVPGCVMFPNDIEKPYLTSTLSHMLYYAIDKNLRGAKRKKPIPFSPIEIYGFEAESGTEYAHQRPCIEYWVGYGRGHGMSITAPGSGLLTGRHYGYENHDQGYRSRLEMRKQTLQANLAKAEQDAVKSDGYLEALTPFKNIKSIRPHWNEAFDDHFRKKNMVSFIRGTIKELDNAIAILDGYRLDTDEAKQIDVRRLIELQYGLG